MKYSFLCELLRALYRIPGALRCYFVHSWTEWKECPRGDWYEYKCDRCGRNWGDNGVVM